MECDREALIEDVRLAQRLIIQTVQTRTVPYWLQLELSMAQLKGLLTLATVGNTTMSQFATTLRIGSSAASLLADRLVRDGFVERTEDAQDRRRTQIRLSPRGEELVTLLRQGREQQHPVKVALHRLSDHDLAALAQGMRAFATGIQAVLDASSFQDEHEQEAQSTS